MTFLGGATDGTAGFRHQSNSIGFQRGGGNTRGGGGDFRTDALAGQNANQHGPVRARFSVGR